MSLTEINGFFAKYYLNLRNSQVDYDKFDTEISKLTSCRDDFQRVDFVSKLDWVQIADEKLQVKRDYASKDAAKAVEFKNRGNEAFKAKKWFDAMILYNKSYVALPIDRVAELAIILANRSASLYHLQKYNEALLDINRALKLGYPKDIVYKLYERQARCFLAKKDYPNSIEAFKKCITSVDDSILPTNRRAKMNLDAMTMIKMLENDPRTTKQSMHQKNCVTLAVTSLSIPDEKEYISSSIKFDQNVIEGRFARACSDIKIGEEILVEKPFVAVLLPKYAQTHCENCFVRTAIPIACPKCADVIYCSEKCQQHAAAKYHRFECGLLPIIWRSGVSVNCHIALRIFASRNMDYFLNIMEKLENKMALSEIQKLPKDDYRRVCHLVRHETQRSASNYFQHTLMARFLTKCLAASNYFGTSPSTLDIRNISALLLGSLQFIQFNTHEVSELHRSQTNGEEKTLFIGGAIYPNLALFNHSCDPGVVRYFRGTVIHINTICPIQAGLPINENYGPIYTQETRDVRQSKLKELYCFECNCDACIEDWPTIDKLPTDAIRFRCDAPNNCSAVIKVPSTCNDFMRECGTCGETTNILKGLKVMQDTELMIRSAKRCFDAGNYSKALNKYIDILKIMHEVLVPPFPDYCSCQQNIKDCFLHFGNFYKLD